MILLQANEEALRVKALVINEPTSVRLSDGSSMPITGLGTGAPGLTAETIKCVFLSLSSTKASTRAWDQVERIIH